MERIGVDLPDRDDRRTTRRSGRPDEAVQAAHAGGVGRGLRRHDACVAPVRTPRGRAAAPHLAARGTFVDRDGVTQPAPAPRFSRTAATLSTRRAPRRAHREALNAWGVADVDALLASGAAVQA